MAVGDASESADGQRRANPVAESVEEVTSSGCERGRWVMVGEIGRPSGQSAPQGWAGVQLMGQRIRGQ